MGWDGIDTCGWMYVVGWIDGWDGMGWDEWEMG